MNLRQISRKMEHTDCGNEFSNTLRNRAAALSKKHTIYGCCHICYKLYIVLFDFNATAPKLFFNHNIF